MKMHLCLSQKAFNHDIIFNLKGFRACGCPLNGAECLYKIHNYHMENTVLNKPCEREMFLTRYWVATLPSQKFSLSWASIQIKKMESYLTLSVLSSRGRSREWHSKVSGYLLASGLLAIRDTFRADHKETKIWVNAQAEADHLGWFRDVALIWHTHPSTSSLVEFHSHLMAEGWE